jgi:hypothetical protein
MSETRKSATSKDQKSTAVLTPVRDEDLRAAAGGRKAGREQLDYLKFTLEQAFVTG